MPLLPLTPTTATATQGPRLAVGRPRYQRARLVGDGLVTTLPKPTLLRCLSVLRPGSYKSVRFALELLLSHLGQACCWGLVPHTWKGGPGVHHPALSQRAQVQAGEGRWLG